MKAAMFDSANRAPSGVVVDRKALPGDAAEPELGSEGLAQPRRRERANHVAAAADAEHQGSISVG
jgi:hypothetical protein